MSQLSKQSIRKLCLNSFVASDHTGIAVDHANWHPLIYPFEPAKVKVQGVSKGLSAASYDASIAHDLVLGRHPGYIIREWVLSLRFANAPKWYEYPSQLIYFFTKLRELQRNLMHEPKHYALAHTVEDFCFPANVAGAVCDKSTFARVFVSAYNTFFDPGFHGNATLELVNDSDQVVTYKAGQGVCQFIFTWLDEPTEEPYAGKYNGQTKAAHGPRWEADDSK